ncbi:hypothetical protein CACET_c17680 [Clostridium aceticum]|uniref:Uncharacterized protein n=1 Tax=Clostridium aceticum TaxID=84022 RepID=A0A0G3W969_9CLOT|nr:hypothetical protein CACET_c17680 [Clostridium aceticum]
MTLGEKFGNNCVRLRPMSLRTLKFRDVDLYRIREKMKESVKKPQYSNVRSLVLI